MTKILMVCLGNICRSPLAEGVLRHHLTKRSLQHIEVDSAGTSSWHAGENPDSRSVQNAKQHGVDISKLVSRQFTAADFERFDRIYVMDASNYRDVIQLAKSDAHREKVSFVLDTIFPGENRAVPDPYYGGEEGFENVFRLLEKAALAICDQLVETSSEKK
jgi:protein-tyrosine phosphatase